MVCRYCCIKAGLPGFIMCMLQMVSAVNVIIQAGENGKMFEINLL